MGCHIFLWIVVPKTFFVITEHTFQEKREEEENKKNLDADDDLFCKGQNIYLYVVPNNTLLC